MLAFEVGHIKSMLNGLWEWGWKLSVLTGISSLKSDLFPLLRARPVIMSDILDSLRTYLLFNAFTSLESRAAIFFPFLPFLPPSLVLCLNSVASRGQRIEIYAWLCFVSLVFCSFLVQKNGLKKTFSRKPCPGVLLYPCTYFIQKATQIKMPFFPPNISLSF